MKKYYAKPEIELTRFENDDNNMAFVSGNYNAANIKFSKTEYNELDF